MYDLLLKGGTVIDPAQSLALEQIHMLAAEVFPKVRQG